MTAVTLLGGVLFVVAGLHLAGRRARRSVWLLSAGVGAIGLASIVRADDVRTLIGEVLSPASTEAIKHGLIAVGCLFVGLWAAGAISGRPVSSVRVLVLAATVVLAMAVPFVSGGPWDARDLAFQSEGKPGMLVYWGAYYGAFIAATVLFSRSAARGSSQMPAAQRVPLTMMACGGVLATMWALLSIGRQVAALQGQGLAPVWEGIRNGLEPAFTLLLGGGLMVLVGVSTARAWVKRRDLAVLHEYLETEGVPMAPRLASSRRTAHSAEIDIADSLAFLGQYGPEDSRGPCPEVLERAVRAWKEGRRPHGDRRWDWASDPQVVRALGAELRARRG